MSENITLAPSMEEIFASVSGTEHDVQDKNISLTTEPAAAVVETQEKEEPAPSAAKPTVKKRQNVTVDELKKGVEESKALEAQTLERAFDLRHRMARVYTSVYTNPDDGKKSYGYIYAAFIREETSGKSRLLLQIEYPNMPPSELIELSQIGIFDKSRFITSNDTKDKSWLKGAKSLEILSEYCTTTMDIDYVKLFCTLQKHFNEIPVGELKEQDTLYEVYKRIKEYVLERYSRNNKSNKAQEEEDNCDFNPKDDYELDTNEFNNIAMEAGYEPDRLKKLLALHDVLLTDGGKKSRYQKSKRTSDGVKRLYVIKNEIELLEQVKQQKTDVIIIKEEDRPNVITHKHGFVKYK